MSVIHIIKIGGKVLEDNTLLQHALQGVAQLEEPKVVVHGGDSAVSKLAQRLGIDPTMEEGQWNTDEALLEVMCLAYPSLNKLLVSKLQAVGCDAMGLCGADLSLIKASRQLQDPKSSYNGDIEEVQGAHILELLRNDFVPVIAPLTHDGNGQLLKTNADAIAAEVALALELYAPIRLVYCFELPGLLRDPHDPESYIHILTKPEFEALKAKGAIFGGMIHKLNNAFAAVKQGIMQVVICSPDALSQLNAPVFPGTIISN